MLESGLTLSIVALLAIASFACGMAYSARKAGALALSTWSLAWASHLLSASCELAAVYAPWFDYPGLVFGSLVAPLMLMGSYQHVQRNPSSIILSLGLIIGFIRVGAEFAYGPALPQWIATLTEPAMGLIAARTIYESIRARKEDSPSRSNGDRRLVLGLTLFAVTEFLNAALFATGHRGWPAWALWIVFGTPLFVVQVDLYFKSLGRRARVGEESAKIQEHRLRLLTDATDLVIIEYDDRGRITYFSENASRQFETTLSPIVGENIRRLLHEERDSQIVRALDERGRITESDILADSSGPTCVIDRLGVERWFEVTRSTYRTANHELRIFEQGREITERIFRERSVREAENRLHRAEEVTGFGSWEYLAKTDSVFWSKTLYAMHGMTPSVGPLDLDDLGLIIEPSDLARLLDFKLTDIGDQSLPEIGYRVRRSDGAQPRYLRTLFEVEYDELGRLERIAGTTRDITTQFAMEEALREGRKHLDSLINSNIVGVFYVDPSGIVTDANSAFLSLLGYKESDLPLAFEVLLAEETKFLETDTNEIIQTGAIQPSERAFRARDGSLVHFLVGTALIGREQAIVIAVDVSERRRAEEYVARQQRILEDTIAERTQELFESRSQLLESERLAAVGILTAGVAHQINNPIGAILTSAEFALLCEEEENAHQIFRDALVTSLAESRRCARIVKSMLQFSRDEPTEKWVEDLSSVLRRAARAIKPYANDRDAHVELTLPSEPLFAHISPIAIEQAMVNIVRNAIESQDRGAQVSISLTARDKSAQVEVTDNGKGFPTEARDHLFEPFYTRRTREGGTGLGLSVAHGVVLDHNGEISIESVPGEGTRVRMTLPLVEGEIGGKVEPDERPRFFWTERY